MLFHNCFKFFSKNLKKKRVEGTSAVKNSYSWKRKKLVWFVNEKNVLVPFHSMFCTPWLNRKSSHDLWVEKATISSVTCGTFFLSFCGFHRNKLPKNFNENLKFVLWKFHGTSTLWWLIIDRGKGFVRGKIALLNFYRVLNYFERNFESSSLKIF